MVDRGAGQRGPREPGRAWTSLRQRDGGAVMAHGQIRAHLFAGLHGGALAAAGLARMVCVLQRAAVASGTCQPDPGSGIKERPLRRTGRGPEKDFGSAGLLQFNEGEEEEKSPVLDANLKSAFTGPKDGERLSGLTSIFWIY